MIKISQMSGKLKGIGAINTNPLTNSFCQQMCKKGNLICNKCYAIRNLKTFRANAVPAFEHNSKELSSRLLKDDEIPNLSKYKYFRLSGYGDLINETHAKNYDKIIEKNPNTFFAWWTKRLNLMINVPRRNNCNYIYSNPSIDKIINKPKGFDKTFNVKTIKSNLINCHGGCFDCKICYTKNNIISVNEVIK